MALLIKKILLFILPLVVITAAYLITDPYKIIYNYQSYGSSYIMLSRGNVSTMMFMRNRDKYHYDSFIFGSSRTCSNTSAAWAKYLPKGSKPFSFGAWNESVEGIYTRLKLLDSLHNPINNAFVLLDVDKGFTYSTDIRADHYLITGATPADYQKNHYYSYLKSPLLWLESLDYKLFHKQRAYMVGFVGERVSTPDTINNDWYPNSEADILRDSAAYYKACESKFYQRSPTQKYAPKQVYATQQAYLIKIAALLRKNHANYKIVIAPLYDQVKLNQQDLALLQKTFGTQNVYDYSGINNITADKFNYGSDMIHYRKKVGETIYKQIYTDKPAAN